MASRLNKRRKPEEWERVIITVIRASRVEANLTRQELADRMGLSHHQIINLEHGRRSVRLSDFIPLADAIGVDPVKLFERIARW